MKIFKHLRWTAILALIICSAADAQKSMSLVSTYPLTGDGHYDYLASAKNGQLYVSHGDQVNIMDEMTGKQTGVIGGLSGVHGIAFDYAINRGFISNGKGNNVSVFDLATNKVLTTVATGNNPDGIMYEPYTKTIITANGKSKDLSIIDPRSNEVTHTVPLAGKPEAMASDGNGCLYVNIEDKNLIQVVDLHDFKVIRKIDLAPQGEEPSGLAIDTQNKLLFSGCSNKELLVVNYKTGTVIGEYPIGDGCDGVVRNPATGAVFASNGEGTLTVLKPAAGGKYTVQNIVTRPGARTIALNPATNTIYLSTADVSPATVQGKRTFLPGTFKVLVIR